MEGWTDSWVSGYLGGDGRQTQQDRPLPYSERLVDEEQSNIYSGRLVD